MQPAIAVLMLLRLDMPPTFCSRERRKPPGAGMVAWAMVAWASSAWAMVAWAMVAWAMVAWASSACKSVVDQRTAVGNGPPRLQCCNAEMLHC